MQIYFSPDMENNCVRVNKGDFLFFFKKKTHHKTVLFNLVVFQTPRGGLLQALCVSWEMARDPECPPLQVCWLPKEHWAHLWVHSVRRQPKAVSPLKCKDFVVGRQAIVNRQMEDELVPLR